MIDRQTVDRILSTADIVDVVSDFVTLKKRGANWVGLCPFHNDRNPSFYVSRAKGICKCFSCGKGGSPVNFIMEHEQLSYVEALKYLARKYHIEIQERELTDKERAEQTQREAMLMLNEWACQWFEQQLHDTDEGRDVGMAYFRERAFSDESINKFHLGYSPENRNALYRAATAKGFNRQLLFDTGLCTDDNHGGGYDRFRGRVMFPIFNVAGKVVGFGGRTLRNDPAKYVNSPESIIYNKRNELYGLSQAKRAISKENKCFIVEGYADVISMHQAGFENVIASSGTALTEEQIHVIHRFTENVTELFDGDAAGIHAALRGVDMLLREGLNIKVLPLPEEDDPDSFARSHSASEIAEYIQANETDFIRFKANVLLKDCQGDPIKQSQAITDVVGSIANIPSPITRSVYAKECSTLFGVDERMLLHEIQKRINANRTEEAKRKQRERERARLQAEGVIQPQADEPEATAATPAPTVITKKAEDEAGNEVIKQERELIRLIVKYAMCFFCDTAYEDGSSRPTTVVEYVNAELQLDDMRFSDPLCQKIFDIAINLAPTFYQDWEQYEQQIEQERKNFITEQCRAAVNPDMGSEEIKRVEDKITAKANAQAQAAKNEFRQDYLVKQLVSSPDTEVRNFAFNAATSRYQLSKIHTQFATILSEFDRLETLVPGTIDRWKSAIVQEKINALQQKINECQTAGGDDKNEELLAYMTELSIQIEIQRKLSKLIGERIINPRATKA